ncbi:MULTISPECIES: M23 family metallopeptidase [unclassified Nocardioides]|uniref:M23 family metallopeptidase n=1 Tax=unclassified Nocardioides TaxID=2615069 RepID=UPI001EE3AD1D|nr:MULTISPECIES: M23 family metallopeptidase [unclassified Nocardioides]
MTSRLHSWAGVGTFLVAAAVTGYAGITVAQAVSLATAGDVAVTVVADPPVRTAPTQAATAADPGGPYPAVVAEAPQPTPATGRPTGEKSGRKTAQQTDPSRATGKDADRGPSRSSTTARKATPAAAEPEKNPTRRERLEIKHAMWADRQLAAMLRATSQTMQWFGGAPWTTPVADYHLTARFGASGRLWSSTHTGLDFAAPTGTPVRAATAGTVTSVAWAGAYGNKVEITHPDGTETWYAHLSRTDVRVGARVGTGAVIGAVGATGNVTGSHLHFEVRPAGGSPVDPENALEEHGVDP